MYISRQLGRSKLPAIIALSESLLSLRFALAHLPEPSLGMGHMGHGPEASTNKQRNIFWT